MRPLSPPVVLVLWLLTSSSGLLMIAMNCGHEEAGLSTEAKNEALVRAFLEAWERLDPDELTGYFTADAVYHNVPRRPLVGTDAIREALVRILAGHDAMRFEILTLVADGHVVVAERVDHLWAGDVHVPLPVMGIFELQGGRIAAWRDYFDPAPVEPIMAVLQERQAWPA
jgi:limonene-1,2-epoxide hydrolase